MKRRSVIVGIVLAIGSQGLYADWTDSMDYADDAAIQAVYGAEGVFSSSYAHIEGQTNYTYIANTALGMLASNGKYGVRALDRVAGTPTVSVEAWILPYTYEDPAASPYSASFNLNNATGWDDWHASVKANGELLQVYDDDEYVTLDVDGDGDVDGDDVLAEDTYYKIKIVATPDTVNGGAYDVYINDVLAYENAGFRNGNTLEDSSYVRFSRGGTGGATMAVDDVTVTSIGTFTGGWKDSMNYAGDAAIQAVYTNYNGLYSSSYGHVYGKTNHVYDSGTALGLYAVNGKYALRALDRPAGTSTVSVEAWICPFTWESNPTSDVYTADFQLAHSNTNWNDWHANVRASGGRFEVLDYDTYVTLDIDGDGDVDGDDVLVATAYYKLRIEATPDAVNGGTYDVYINDVLVYEDALFRKWFTTQDSIYVRFSRGGNGGAPMAVDDVSVTATGVAIGDITMEFLPATDEFVMTWAASDGRLYALEEKSDLGDDWGTNTTVLGTGGDVSATTTASQAASFYRVTTEL